jgi:hypothetical protein
LQRNPIEGTMAVKRGAAASGVSISEVRIDRAGLFDGCREGAEMILLIAIGLPVCVAFSHSVASLIEERTALSFVQLLGAFCLMIVVFAHIAESFSLFPRMGWGLPDSAGHYVDLVCAVAGLILFPIGYLTRRLLGGRFLHAGFGRQSHRSGSGDGPLRRLPPVLFAPTAFQGW